MNWKKFLKITSIIEILLGLVIGGFGGFIFLFSMSVVEPTAIIGLILGVPMILLSTFLIIFGVNLLKFKRWAWLASVITLIIVIVFFIAFKDYSQPIFISLCLGAVICLILLILGRIKEREISIPWKKIIIVALIIAGVVGYYLYRNLQRPVSPPVTLPEIEEPVEPETSEYKIYKHKIYGYDMVSLETPILEVIVFNDQNESGVMDPNEKGLQNIHLDEYWGNMVYIGGILTPENGIVNFNRFPLRQKITISFPTRDNKYWGWRTAFKEGWPVTTINKYEFTLTEIPEETKIIYFGLKKLEEPVE